MWQIKWGHCKTWQLPTWTSTCNKEHLYPICPHEASPKGAVTPPCLLSKLHNSMKWVNIICWIQKCAVYVFPFWGARPLLCHLGCFLQSENAEVSFQLAKGKQNAPEVQNTNTPTLDSQEPKRMLSVIFALWHKWQRENKTWYRLEIRPLTKEFSPQWELSPNTKVCTSWCKNSTFSLKCIAVSHSPNRSRWDQFMNETLSKEIKKSKWQSHISVKDNTGESGANGWVWLTQWGNKGREYT